MTSFFFEKCTDTIKRCCFAQKCVFKKKSRLVRVVYTSLFTTTESGGSVICLRPPLNPGTMFPLYPPLRGPEHWQNTIV